MSINAHNFAKKISMKKILSKYLNEYGNIKITVVGLGYVGLPLASALSNYYDVVGYDTSRKKILDLKKGLIQQIN